MLFIVNLQSFSQAGAVVQPTTRYPDFAEIVGQSTESLCHAPKRLYQFTIYSGQRYFLRSSPTITELQEPIRDRFAAVASSPCHVCWPLLRHNVSYIFEHRQQGVVAGA